MSSLHERLKAAGISRADLAQRLGVTVGLVGHWCNGRVAISAERALEIEQKTGGTITRAALRPDLFGEQAA